MDISVEITGSLARRLTVVVPAVEIEKAAEKRAQELIKTTKLDGFRPGKVPLSVVKQRFGDAIRGEVIEKALQSSLSDALKQEKLQPAEPPAIQSLEAEAGQPLKYSATFEVYPEVHISGLGDVTLEKTVVDIEAADVEKVLEQMSKQHVEWEVSSNPVQVGDKVTMDFVRLVEGEPQAESEQKDVSLVMDKNRMSVGFEKLLGASVGDELTIELPEQAGVKSQANVKINKIEAPKLPAVDDELAKKMGVETLEELRTQVRNHMEQELNSVLKGKLKTQLIDKLVEKYTFELPKALVEKEREHLEQEWLERLRRDSRTEDATLPPEAKEKSLETARRRVTLSILFAEVIKLHDIQLDNNLVKEHIMRFAGSFQEPQFILNLLQKQPELLGGIRSQVMEAQVVDKLLEQVNYTEKAALYADVMHFTPDSEEGEHVHDEHCNHEHEGQSA